MANEKDSLRSKILTNELGNRMLDMVAPIYDKSKLALYVFQAIGTALSKETEFVAEDFINQMVPQKATWGLKYWEDEFGIIPDESKSLDQRRAYLMSVMYKKNPMTPYRIRQIVTGITNMECEVIENYAPNTFFVTIRGYFPNISIVKAELDKKTPAHLNYIVRMAELDGIEVNTASGVAVTEYERYEVEVLN